MTSPRWREYINISVLDHSRVTHYAKRRHSSSPIDARPSQGTFARIFIPLHSARQRDAVVVARPPTSTTHAGISVVQRAQWSSTTYPVIADWRARSAAPVIATTSRTPTIIHCSVSTTNTPPPLEEHQYINIWKKHGNFRGRVINRGEHTSLRPSCWSRQNNAE